MKDILVNNDQLHKALLQVVSNVTGHAVEDLEEDLYLEGDLGMDSIKMVSLMNELIRLVPSEEREAFQQKHPASDLMSLETIGDLMGLFDGKETQQQKQMEQEDSTPFSAAGARSMVLGCIAAITGHKENQLEDDLFLEGDLGIDSIKMVSLMNELMKLVPADKREEFTSLHPISGLMSVQTVGDILDIFDKWGLEQSTISLNNVETAEKVKGFQPEYLEILNAQYPFLAAYWSVSNITIDSCVKVQGEFNLQVLEGAWKSVIMSHPILRSVFETEACARHFGQYRLKMLSHITLPEIPVYDIRNINAEEKEFFVMERLEKGINGKFDLFTWPLHRMEIVLFDEECFGILCFFNHTVTDGLGNQQFLRELLEAYGKKLRGEELTYGSFLPQQYNQLVDRMNRWNSPEELSQMEKYLKSQGKSRYFFNPLSKKLSTEPFNAVITKTSKYWLDAGTTSRLTRCTAVFKTSVFVLLVSAYVKTIAGYEKPGKNIILNLPTGGKVYPDADATGVLGCFAQNMALSFDTTLAAGPWETLVEHVGEHIRGAITSGLDRAQVFSAARNAVTQETLENGKMSPSVAAFIRQTIKSNLYLSYVGNTGLKEQYDELKVCDYEAYTCTNPGTIDNLVELFHGRLIITSNYDSGFFDRSFIDELMQEYIKNIRELAGLSEQADTKSNETVLTLAPSYSDKIKQLFEEVCLRNISQQDFSRDLDGELGMDSLQRIRFIAGLSRQIPGLDKNAIFTCRTLSEIVNAAGNGTDNLNIVQTEIPYLQIVEQCKKTPEAVAIKFGNQKLTYRELHDSSNKLANCLQSRGIRAGSFVGILTLPGPFMLLGMLGILKAGAAYIPVDPVYPAERIEYIINHSKMEVLVTEQELNTQLAVLLDRFAHLRTVVCMDEGDEEVSCGQIRRITRREWMAFPAAEPVYESSPDDLMTVLYTSGSTGKPKGVMLNHRGYMNRLVWHQKTFRVKPGECVAQRTSCCFDISVWELFWPLMYGAAVCPVRKDIVRNPWKLAQWMEDNEISIMHFVPSLFGEFVNALEDDHHTFKKLRWLIFSGEALPMSLIQKWMDRYGTSTGLANLYGPTEASIDVTCHIIDKRPGLDGETSIPIGKPIDNVYIRNLDHNMRELPEGETGELWIGGIQLAKGYLHNTEKTAEVFKQNPFPEIPGEFLYKTGDLTVRKADGSYEFHGRADHQVKIRGFRIELGEIEAVLSTVPGISEAAVTMMEEPEGSGQKFLVAWLAGIRLEDRKVKESISRKLPEYMIPHRFQWLECLPKNPNGKLDRKALSADKASRSDSARLAVRAAESSNIQTRQDAGPGGLLALTPAQSWLMTYFDYPYSWTGYTRFLYKMPLDLELFNRALNELVNRHTSLQCIFVQENSRWYQKIITHREILTAAVYDAGSMEPVEREEAMRNLVRETVSGFSVEQWPLLKVIILRVSDSLYDIAVVGHHLISDMLTNHLLFREIWRIYSQLLSNPNLSDIHNLDQYTDYIQLTESAKSENMESYLEYWREKFPSPDSAFLLPADFTKGPNNEGSAQMVHFELDKESTALLTGKLKKEMNAGVYSLLMAPLYRMLARKTGREKVVVGHRVHGRDIGNGRTFLHTAGNFAVNYPLAVQVDPEAGWAEAVEQFQREMSRVPLNGISYDLCAEMFPMYLYPDIKLAGIRANYLGITDTMAHQTFEFPKEDMDRRYSSPDQKRISILEFFFRVEEKKLKLSIEYSGNMFRAETVTALGTQYMDALKELIASSERRQAGTPAVHLHRQAGALDRKVALVTGGGRGIGRAISLSLAKEGASVAIMAKTGSQLDETMAQIRNSGGDALALPGDITDELAVKGLIKEVIQRYGRIDILVNNAGITKMMPVLNTPPDEWKKIVEVNLFGTYNLCYAVIPHMIKQKSGKIINIGSDSSFIGYPLLSAYAASKHGILGITRSLSEELKNYNIQVNVICPAMVNTDMAPAAFRSRAIDPSQVAEVAVFLASQKSNSITGEALKVYGNQDMNWFGAQHAGLLKSIL